MLIFLLVANWGGGHTYMSRSRQAFYDMNISLTKQVDTTNIVISTTSTCLRGARLQNDAIVMSWR